jgi:hypothetical protein
MHRVSPRGAGFCLLRLLPASGASGTAGYTPVAVDVDENTGTRNAPMHPCRREYTVVVTHRLRCNARNYNSTHARGNACRNALAPLRGLGFAPRAAASFTTCAAHAQSSILSAMWFRIAPLGSSAYSPFSLRARNHRAMVRAGPVSRGRPEAHVRV